MQPVLVIAGIFIVYKIATCKPIERFAAALSHFFLPPVEQELVTVTILPPTQEAEPKQKKSFIAQAYAVIIAARPAAQKQIKHAVEKLRLITGIADYKRAQCGAACGYYSQGDKMPEVGPNPYDQ